MAKFPSEIFGYYWKDDSKEAKAARKRRWCPFHNSKCFKKSRLVNYPFGVCTAHYAREEIALCPRRFLERNLVFRDIAQHNFGSCNNILVFSEVGLSGIGNFDFVMVKHKPMSAELEDFAVIEFQTGQTTSTGRLVDAFKDFMKKGMMPKGANYSFGINMYDIWKRTFTQILNKGIILETWRKKIFWVVQEPVFRYFQRKYRINMLDYDNTHSTVFALYDLKTSGKRLKLVSTERLSSTIDDLFDAFRTNDDIPPVEDFMARLKTKISTDMKLALRLDASAGYQSVDARRPTSTGRVREKSDEQDAKDQRELFD